MALNACMNSGSRSLTTVMSAVELLARWDGHRSLRHAYIPKRTVLLTTVRSTRLMRGVVCEVV
jgi:hypothetical protein